MDEKDYSLNANEFEKYTWEVIKNTLSKTKDIL